MTSYFWKIAFLLTVVVYITDGKTLNTSPCRKGRSGRYPHATCQAYYDCSFDYDVVPQFFEQHLRECPFPQLYNIETKLCEHYNNVNCATRELLVDACDYLGNKCEGLVCYPCELDFPPCRGLSDGPQPFRTPNYYRKDRYIVCKDDRFVEAKACGVDRMGEHLFFDKNARKCGKLYD